MRRLRWSDFGVFRKLLARRKGFEPLTPRFEVWCSIQLSYRRGDAKTFTRPIRQIPARRSSCARILLSGGLKEINRIDLGVGKHGRRERAAISGTCVDVQAIRSELRQPITQWRVAMNDQSSEIEIARQEWFSYPNEVILALSVQGNIGINASVHVEPPPVVMKKLQATNEFQMRFRKLRRET